MNYNCASLFSSLISESQVQNDALSCSADIECSDLVQLHPDQALRLEIEAAVADWQALEVKFANISRSVKESQPNPDVSSSSSSSSSASPLSICIPFGLNIHDINSIDIASLQHPRIPELHQETYFKAFLDLLKLFLKKKDSCISHPAASLSTAAYLNEAGRKRPLEIVRPPKNFVSCIPAHASHALNPISSHLSAYHANHPSALMDIVGDRSGSSSSSSSSGGCCGVDEDSNMSIAVPTGFPDLVHQFDILRVTDLRVTQTVELLGSQPLVKLTEVLYCVLPSLLQLECVSAESRALPQALSNSDFLFIDGVFYVDTRGSSIAAKEEEILVWMRSRNPEEFPYHHDNSRRHTSQGPHTCRTENRHLHLSSKHSLRSAIDRILPSGDLPSAASAAPVAEELSGSTSSSAGPPSALSYSQMLALAAEKGSLLKRNKKQVGVAKKGKKTPRNDDAHLPSIPPSRTMLPSLCSDNPTTASTLSDEHDWIFSRFSLDPASKLVLRDIQQVTVRESSMKAGTMQLLCHLGSCYHIICASKVRVYDPVLDGGLCSFPRVTYQCKMKRRQCDICLLQSANFVVYGDKLAPVSPFFNCRVCFTMLHCCKEGRLLYDDFAVYPYLHDFG